MLGLAGLPSLLMFMGLLFMPESPRWLVFHGRTEKAKKVLAKIHHQKGANAELTNIVRDYEEHVKLKLSKEMIRVKNINWLLHKWTFKCGLMPK